MFLPRLDNGLVPSTAAMPRHVRQDGKAPYARYACPGNNAPIATLLRPALCRRRRVVTLASRPAHPALHRLTLAPESNYGIYTQISTWNHHIQRPTASAPWFGTILALVSNHPRRVRLPPVSGAKKHGKRQEKACLGEEFPRILARCLSSAQCVGRLADVPFEHSALTPGTTRP